VRVFVSEFICGGACANPSSKPSLAREGRAMLEALLVDFRQVPGCHVITTWNSCLGEFPVNGIECITVETPTNEAAEFRRLTSEADVTFVIAPEFDGILANRRRLSDEVGGHWPGCQIEAIELCADKLALFEHLDQRQIPTVPTALWNPSCIPDAANFPAVLKPRDGAGSTDVRLIDRPEDMPAVFTAEEANRFVVQPYIAGRAISVAVLCSTDGESVEIFPAAEQHLSSDGSHDGRFHYLGGQVPIASAPDHAVEELVRRACDSIPGLNGYIGFDLILPDAAPEQPLIVEINPRLTTSYLGYREHANENLATRMLPSNSNRPPISWKPTFVEWTADGVVSSQPDASARDAGFPSNQE
jgi:predicted ATP-grasp superfamily ATP-dependent carboligase